MNIISAGIFFYSKSTERFLYLLRNDIKNPNWGVPGGKIEENETLLEGLQRECLEEINYWPEYPKLVPIQKFVNNNFTYHTFFCSVDEEFVPYLNNEHCGYAWVGRGNYPKPLHPGLFNTFNIDTVTDKLDLLMKKAV
jgi:8-oxo-dGTP pyrophosphatase MutT (NUDIX family)